MEAASGATPELQTLLRRRLRIVEGSHGIPPQSNLSSLGGAATAPHAGPARLPQHRTTAPGALQGRGAALPGQTNSFGQQHPSLGQRGVPAYQLPVAHGTENRTSHTLEVRVSQLTLRNEQLSQEAEIMKKRLLKDEQNAALSEERTLLLQETDELLAETDRMSEQSRLMMQQREELSAEADKIRAYDEVHSEFAALRSEFDAVRQQNAELTQDARQRATAGGGHAVSEATRLAQEVQGLREQHIQLTALSTAESQRAAQLEASLKEAEGSLSALQQQRAEMHKENEGLSQEVQRHTQEVQRQTNLAQELEMRLKDELKTREQENQRLVDELAAVSQRFAAEQAHSAQSAHHAQRWQADAQQAQRLAAEVTQARAESDQLRSDNEKLQVQAEELRRKNDELRLDNEELRLQGGQFATAAQAATNGVAAQETLPPVDRESSEGRLRAVMTKQGITSDELRQAIGGVEALLDEAKRELERKMLRERRAAFEQLHNAIEKADEVLLQESLVAARRANVEAEDIQKGEAKLLELQSLTEEQKAARANRELELKRKKEAFLLVKKDDAVSLKALIDGLAEDMRWKDWRDYAGRTMWRCAQELRAERVQELLAPLLGMRSPANNKKPEPRAARLPSIDVSEQQADESALDELGIPKPSSPFVRQLTPPYSTREVATEGMTNGVSGSAAHVPVPEIDSQAPADAQASAEPELPVLSETELAELKAKAFKAVVRDECEALVAVLEKVHKRVWSAWENKAGKDLLTLSQERGSSGAYSVLAKALDMIKQMKREAFEERESVWIFVNGDVQPKRATVLEDTPEEADEILVEYWDGDDPAFHVDRCMVRKMWS